MLLIAGLLGLFVSGVMVALPMSDQETGETDESQQEDEQPDGDPQMAELSAGDTSPLSAALDEPTATDMSPPEAATDTRDAIGGDHLTDLEQGSWVPVVSDPGDAMLGNGASDTITGGDGSDLILGDGGNDALHGLGDRDILLGGTGDDTLHGDGGADELHGEVGDDVLWGGDGDDLLSGSEGDDQLDGGDGDDRLFGGEGSDTLRGGAGNDILDGTRLDDVTGADIDAADRLEGGDGDDTLAGGQGDVLSGGNGMDKFLFQAPSATLSHGDADNASPLIEDFIPDDDIIEIAYDGADDPDVRFASFDGVTQVFVDDVLVVRLAGNPAVDASSLQFVRAS